MKVLFLILAAIAVLCYAQQQATVQQNNNDADTLNYALTLEHLEAAFYTQGLALFNASDFQDAGYTGSVRRYITLIMEHEMTHVATLTQVLQTAGYTAVQPCQYNFEAAFRSVNSFIQYASLLEQTGVMAYDGAANTINNAAYLQVAATIATVEARHSAYLNELRNNTPFPDDFDIAESPEEILQAASQFIVTDTCPYPNIPQLAFTYVPLDNHTNYYNQSGQPETYKQIENDNEVLNYALTLELFGQAFYSAVATFTLQDFANAGFADVYPYMQMIIQHEFAHVRFLTNTLRERNAAVAQSCTYNIQNYTDSVVNALYFARMLENLEVTAYDGAINDLTNYQIIQAAATIATVEARHGQYLNNRLEGIAVNQEPFDMANMPAQILNLTSPLFGADCETPLIPVVAYTLQAGQNTQPAPSSSPVPTYTMVPSYSPVPTGCPAPTPTPSSCGTPTPSSSCGCGGSSNDDDDGVTINFYFADILRGM